MSQYLGDISAYALAVSQGYTGTEEEYAELMASYATVGQTAVTAAQTATTKASEAATSATTATNKASEATTAATTATTKAGEASTSASTATSAKDTAVSASQTATTKATEATTAAATATSAKTDAVAANTAAQSAKTAAQTAQTGAETAAASVQSSAAQIQTNAEDISQLKSDFTDMESDGAVPSAEQILSDKGVTDSVPYHYRKTGGDGADRLYDQIVGGSVAWNQLINANSASELFSPNATITASNNTVTLTSSAASGNVVRFGKKTGISSVIGHKALLTGVVTTSVAGKLNFYNGTSWMNGANITAGTPVSFGVIFDVGTNGLAQDTPFGFTSSADMSNDTIVWKNPQIFDLTQMFGSTIADHIYSLEQTTAGAGVAFFKSLFPNDYYQYNAGELISVSGLSEHKMVGFNQWDEEWEIGTINTNTGQNIPYSESFRSKNYIPCLPNTRYYVKFPTGWTVTGFYYDADKNYIYPLGSWLNKVITTPTTCHYMRFSVTNQKTYNHDICINLSDPERNGEYKPYKAHSYPLDPTVELRGLFKLDANNNLYADGDTYDADGKVTRNTILRAYQSGDESLANAITDGTNTVVYSANASTEQADHYQHLQQCDPNGTEEYVSTGIVPVGHKSFYPENLRAKVEQLPWNFASLIAPTESAFVATRNYVTGDLFIVSNVLYKATSNIANGGTITPNTNCTATTLAEIISALA